MTATLTSTPDTTAERTAKRGATGDIGRVVALGVLFAAATFDHYTLPVGGADVKPEHVVLAALLAWVGWDVLRNRRLPGWRAFLPLAAWLAAILAGSLVNAPDTGTSLRHLAMVTVVFSTAYVVYYLADTPWRLKMAARVLVCLGVFEAAMTFVALVADRLGNTFGTQQGNGFIRVPFGTLWEPNVLGSYIGAACMLALSGIFSARDRRYRTVLAGALAFMLAALAFSLARTSWIAVALVGALVWLFYRWQRRSGRLPGSDFRAAALLALAAPLLALVFVATVGSLAFPSTTGSIFLRVDPTRYKPDIQLDSSARARANILSESLPGIAAHPIIGNGAGSFAYYYTDEKGEPGWIPNLELHTLYDGGIVALVALLAGLGLLARATWKALRRAESLSPEVVGLAAGCLVLLIAFQLTEGTWLAYPWLYVGLLARGTQLAGGWARALPGTTNR